MWWWVFEGESCSDPLRKWRKAAWAETTQVYGSDITWHAEVLKLLYCHFHLQLDIRGKLLFCICFNIILCLLRLSGVRSLAKPPSMAQLDKVNSNGLEVEVQDGLPPKIPPYSKLQELCSSGGNSTSSCLAPSPAPLLNVNSSACFSSSGIGLGPRQVSSLGVEKSEGSTSPLLYPRMTGLHRSMESLQLQMSLAPESQEKDKDMGMETLVRGYTTLEPPDKDTQEDRCPPLGLNSSSKVSLSFTDR